jgi:hypothetical protein
VNRELCSAAGGALNGDITAGTCNRGMYSRQTQTCAFSRWLRGKERLKEVLDDVGGHAACCVRCSNSDKLLLNCVLDELGPIVHIDLFHQVVLVNFDGLNAQVEVNGNFLHRQSLGKKLQDLALTRG